MIWKSETGGEGLLENARLGGQVTDVTRMVAFAQQDAVWFFYRGDNIFSSPEVYRCGVEETSARRVEYPDSLPCGIFTGEMNGQPVFCGLRNEDREYFFWLLDLATGETRELFTLPDTTGYLSLVQDGMLYFQDQESASLYEVDLSIGKQRRGVCAACAGPAGKLLRGGVPASHRYSSWYEPSGRTAAEAVFLGRLCSHRERGLLEQSAGISPLYLGG